MNAQVLLKELKDQQIYVKFIDGKLKVRAPKGVITQELCALVSEHKAELLAFFFSLTTDGVTAGAIMADKVTSDAITADGVTADAIPKGTAPKDTAPFGDTAPERIDCPGICSQCGAETAYYSDRGVEYCEQHRFQAVWQQCEASPALAWITQEPFFEQDIASISQRIQSISSSIALDLETTGLSPWQDQVVAISLGIPGQVFVIDMRPYYTLSPDRQVEWRQALAHLFSQCEGVMWIGHNLKFDWNFLAVHFGIQLRQVYDTMLVEQVLHAGREATSGYFTLRETAERYQLKVTKQPRNWFVGLATRPTEWHAPFPHEQLVYMVQDIEIAYRLVDLQGPHVAKHKLGTVMQLENQALPAIASMEVHGILIDKEQWQRILQAKRAQQAKIEQELVETLGAALHASRQQKFQAQDQQYQSYQHARVAEEKRLIQDYTTSQAKGKNSWKTYQTARLKAWDAFHPEPLKPQPSSYTIKLNSHMQVREALAHLGIQVNSTEEEALEAYTRQYPIVERLLRWRKLNHFIRTFGENMLAHIQADQRIHATFFQASAVSGRITCRDPNLQQIPKATAQAREGEDVRCCFIAPEGSRLLTADLSNIELRILAEVSGDATMLDLFAQGKDMHAETARAMFGLSADIDTRLHLHKGVAIRDIAKTINFGLVYGMGVQGLANRIGVSIDEARELIHIYFTTYKEVDTWLRQTTQQVIKSGYATTLAGRRRFFSLTSTDKAQRATIERSARNHPIQGTNADILKRALALLYANLPNRVHLLLCVHDEIVLECPEDFLADAERVLKDAMVRACRDFLKLVAIPEPEVVTARSWIKQ
jgi:DNA polymerase-1